MSSENVSWYKALTLAERLGIWHQMPKQILRQDNTEQSQSRLKRWRAQKPFDTDDYFAQRLSLVNTTEDELSSLIGAPDEIIQKYFTLPPAWGITFERLFGTEGDANSLHSRSSGCTEKELETVGFICAVEPLLQQAAARLKQELQILKGKSAVPFSTDTLTDVILDSLPTRLMAQLTRTLTLELNVARLQGLLSGETPEERFQSFSTSLQDRATLRHLLREYPVLARLLITSTEQWIASSLEFLQHLCTDWRVIESTFCSAAQLGSLTRLRMAGDSHGGGRAVQILGFSCGTQLVYKPRSLAVEKHFQELLLWLNEHGAQPAFKTWKILERGDHGWAEFVPAAGCTSQEEVQRFYERQGSYLALLYTLEANDFHHENLIAAGEHPVLVDLESLFQPHMTLTQTYEVEELAGQDLAYSVLRVGLLPQRLWGNAAGKGLDISGLGAESGQVTPFDVLQVDKTGTDKMCFIRRPAEFPGAQNRPQLNGNNVNILIYTDYLLTGFTRMYYLLLDCRSAFLDEQGPLARFARDKVRAILRPTRTYGALLQESYHPDMLRDALVREQLFDRLWMEVDEQPYLMRVIPSEQADLWHGDVPIFSTQPGSRHLWDSRGICLEYFFEESGVDLVKQRLMQLSKKDLDKQLWFVRAALTTLKSDGLQTINEQRTIHPVNADISNTLDRDLFLSEACALGDKLELLAFRGKDNGVSWHVLSPVGQHWHLMPTSIDLYSGISGITLFLAYLGEISGEEQYTKLAQSALQTILRLATDSRARLKSVGAFDGWGGIIYTLSHLGKLWNQPHLINEAREIVELLPALIEQDKSLDIIGGSAGCIQSILSLYSLASSKQILDVAIQCGNKLITNAQTQATGVGWQAHISTLQPLSGLSHGAAGIALALLSLAEKTGEGRFRDTALAAQTYERSLFCKETNNWYAPRDFGKVNTGTKDNGTQTTWCYGAPGIALAHLATLYYLDNREIRAEINTALLTTLQDGWGMGHSLCHGDLGNLEALLVASEVLQESIWMQKAQRIGHTTVDSIRHQGTICGTPLGVETPGLMVGLAGIGYGLLRLAAPDRVPSLLSLSPPK